MGKNIESYALAVEKREDLMQCYREVAPTCITQSGAWRKTVKHPAKRYYVSAHQAYQQVNLYLQGRTEEIDRMMPLHRKMWLSLIEEVKKVAQEAEYAGKPLVEICRVAVMRPAPEFFICPDHMKRIFFRMKNRLYDKDGRFKASPPSPSPEGEGSGENRE